MRCSRLFRFTARSVADGSKTKPEMAPSWRLLHALWRCVHIIDSAEGLDLSHVRRRSHLICFEASSLVGRSMTRSMLNRFEVLHPGHGENHEKQCGGLDTRLGHRRRFLWCDDVTSIGRALSPFYAAVAQEYGQEQAAKAAQDWVEELQTSCAQARLTWRSVSIAAARRLAERLSSLAHERSRPYSAVWV